ncbi:hypothetical protein [Phenylobacterium sp. J367]|uniref:hypothetical protein n=1 Tax=Phenylobacterium sp. J367 TaxID=2898435 RepID=UPI002150B987|nr:hypothetical protein [Phenylobacterium sp. J367]MCR5879580.1 hypothetical protein [Phenylobacterium sp. J367]
MSSSAVTLEDKWTVERGRILISGTQAIVRALLLQKSVDRRAGVDTAGYISGYRGSPLGGVDTALWSISARLEAADIMFRPGVNEDLAATAIRGTQQIDILPGATRDGVFAAWYGKGPGVDRSGDALKHGNSAGSHPRGGVLCFYGDDHAGKSSSISHQSDQAMAAAMIPSLYPATVGEILEYSLMGIALSRYSGCWVGIKCVNETVEQTATVDIDIDAFSPVAPERGPPPPEGFNIRPGHHLNPLRNEQIVIDVRLPLVRRFVRANRIDRTIFRSASPKLGIVTAGKSYSDVLGALASWGSPPRGPRRSGSRSTRRAAPGRWRPRGCWNSPRATRPSWSWRRSSPSWSRRWPRRCSMRRAGPSLTGKADEAGDALLSAVLQLTPAEIAAAIAGRLARLGAAGSLAFAPRRPEAALRRRRPTTPRPRSGPRSSAPAARTARPPGSRRAASPCRASAAMRWCAMPRPRRP